MLAKQHSDDILAPATITGLETTQMDMYERQDQYTNRLAEQGFDYSLAVGDAFIRSIRDIGYKDSGWALADLIDNAIQAGAGNIMVFLNTGQGKGTNVTEIAIVDDGGGMSPSMTRAAVLWGGTDRHDDRSGFGRFGYGLPSASLSIGRVFKVFSTRGQGADVHSVELDVDVIKLGFQVPQPESSAVLPEWLAARMEKSAHWTQNGLMRGTAVVISNVDKLRPSGIQWMKAHYPALWGVMYKDTLLGVNLYLDDERVDPVDQLFITEGMRDYEIPGDPDKALAKSGVSFTLKRADPQTGEIRTGEIRVRYSELPATFASKIKTSRPDLRSSSRTHELRFRTMHDHNGIAVRRNGRLIDVIERIPSDMPWPDNSLRVFLNNDRYWACEIDFDATLDDQFSITTTKQQVRLEESIWDGLMSNGVPRTLSELRKAAHIRLDERSLAQSKGPGPSPGEQAATESKPMLPPLPELAEGPMKEWSDDGFKRELKKRAEEANLPEDVVGPPLKAELAESEYKIIADDFGENPFYRAVPVGGQLQVLLNTKHPFYTEIFAPSLPQAGGNSIAPGVHEAIVVMLCALGQAEADAYHDEGRRNFYRQERGKWSENMRVMLEHLAEGTNKRDVLDPEALVPGEAEPA